MARRLTLLITSVDFCITITTHYLGSNDLGARQLTRQVEHAAPSFIGSH